MKKIWILFFIMCCCYCPKVSADVSGPYLQKFKVIVASESAIVDFDYSGTQKLVKGTILEVFEEYVDEECNCTMLYAKYNDKFGYIKLTDVVLEKEFVEPSKDFYHTETLSSIVLKDGTYLYSGPSSVYKKVSSAIPIGTKLNHNYTDEFGGWYYTEYDGVKGWVNIGLNNYNLASNCQYNSHNVCEPRNIYTLKEKKMYDSPFIETAKEINQKIPVGKELNYLYYYFEKIVSYDMLYDSYEYFWYYVDYNGVKGWIYDCNDENGIINRPYNLNVIFPIEGVYLYSGPSNELKTDVEVKTETIVPALYKLVDQKEWYMIEYKGKKYWISKLDKIGTSLTQTTNKVDMYADSHLYTSPKYDSNKVVPDLVKKGTEVSMLYNYMDCTIDEKDCNNWYYIEHNGEKGWVIGKDGESLEIEQNKIYNEAILAIEEAEKTKDRNKIIEAYKKVNSLFDTNPEKKELLRKLDRMMAEITDEEKPTEIKEEIIKNPKIKNKQLIYNCVIVATALFFGALAMLSFKSKKKNVQKENNESNLEPK